VKNVETIFQKGGVLSESTELKAKLLS